jgi:hypothetical protein
MLNFFSEKMIFDWYMISLRVLSMVFREINNIGIVTHDGERLITGNLNILEYHNDQGDEWNPMESSPNKGVGRGLGLRDFLFYFLFIYLFIFYFLFLFIFLFFFIYFFF